MTVQSRSLVDRLWDFFCSLRLTLFVLLLLALTSIIGTIIPQGRSQADYLQVYSEKVYRLFNALDLYDMYGSWWFIALLALMAINLIACSINRFPQAWKLVTQPQRMASDALLDSLGNREEFVSRRSPEEVRQALAAVLEQRFRRPEVTEADGRICLFVQKGAFSRFGAYVVHASIIVILIGAILGTVWGQKAFVNIPEGGETEVVYDRKSGQPIQLGFAVRCDDFNVSFYPGSRQPREFKSLLTVLENGVPVAGLGQVPLIVNGPLTYGGWTFYQSSYGMAGDPQFVLQVRPRAGGEAKEVVGSFGRLLSLPDGGGAFRLFPPPASMERFGSGVAVQIIRPGQPAKTPFMVFEGRPEFDEKRGGDYVFHLVRSEQPMYTGLQVAKDPGVPLVWLGCGLMVLGCCVAFFLSHRRLWVLVQPLTDGRTGITLAGTAHRNQPAFEQLYDGLKGGFQAALADSGQRA